jgi:hypothetical protein
MLMSDHAPAFDFAVGEKVALTDDDWTLVGREIVVVDVEPVPGSTQCLIRAGDEFRTVSRGELRHLQAA